VFDKQGTEIKEAVEARKVQITDEKAWELLKVANEIVVGRGKKSQTFKPSTENKAEILNNCLGRTGNLRAPTLKIGNMIIVGFNEEMYENYLTK
jgi:hypothetical protein